MGRPLMSSSISTLSRALIIAAFIMGTVAVSSAQEKQRNLYKFSSKPIINFNIDKKTSQITKTVPDFNIDKISPRITKTVPENGALLTNYFIEVNFSEPVRLDSLRQAISLKSTALLATAELEAVVLPLDSSSMKFMIRPKGGLKPNVAYIVRFGGAESISKGEPAVSDLAGNPLDHDTKRSFFVYTADCHGGCKRIFHECFGENNCAYYLDQCFQVCD